jgi:cephalosporin hydroxylase
MKAFNKGVIDRINDNGQNEELTEAANAFTKASVETKYSYNFSWLGGPIIQYSQDIVTMRELIWSIQPDLISKNEITQDGSLILSAYLLELNATCGGPQNAGVLEWTPQSVPTTARRSRHTPCLGTSR